MFSGVVGAPAQCFPAQASCGGPYTTLATSPVTREAPYLYADSAGQLQGLRAARRGRLRGHVVGRRADAGSSIPIDRVLRRQPDRLGADDQQRTRPGPEPDLHSGRLPGRQDDQREAGRHASCSASASRRWCPNNGDRRDVGRRRAGGQARRADVRRRPGELTGAARGRHQERPQERPGRPDDAERRVLPHRRGDSRQGHDQPRREQRRRHPGRHLGLARRPRQRRRLDRQHRRHRRDRQRRQRHGLRPVRRALPEVRGDLERQQRHGRSSSRTRCPTTRRARRPGQQAPASSAGPPSRSPTP